MNIGSWLSPCWDVRLYACDGPQNDGSEYCARRQHLNDVRNVSQIIHVTSDEEGRAA